MSDDDYDYLVASHGSALPPRDRIRLLDPGGVRALCHELSFGIFEMRFKEIFDQEFSHV